MSESIGESATAVGGVERVRILAVDTTGEIGSIALLENERLVEQVQLEAPDGFSQILFQEIQAMLERQGLGFGDVDVFASAAGPGSFTGVRIGLTAVKGLAEATGGKVAAISNLQAMAWFGAGALRAPVMDARRGEIYGAVYDASLQVAAGETAGAEIVNKLELWLADVMPLSPEFLAFENGIALPDELKVTWVPRAIASAIGQIAYQRWLRGELQDPVEIDANYVRRSDAELFWKEA